MTSGSTDVYRDQFSLQEFNIFGSSRVGVRTDTKMLEYSENEVSGFLQNGEFNYLTKGFPVYLQFDEEKKRSLGKKQFELTNHLGNVLATISDRKGGSTDVSFSPAIKYDPAIISAQDYYPFGMIMPKRSVLTDKYRFGFNGQEKDDEWTGSTGATYDYGFRIYDSRIARFLSVDPLSSSYPWYTPYQFAGNNPIAFIDLDGLEEAQPKMRNVIILINPTDKQVEALANDQSKNNNWHVINASTITDAAKQFKTYMGEEKAENVVIRSHGSSSGPALVPEGDNVDGNLISSGKLITSEQLMRFSAIGKHPMADTEEGYKETFGEETYNNVKALGDIAGGVEDGGNIIFSGCNVGKGTFGETAVKSFNSMYGTKLNVYTNQDKSSSYRQDKGTGSLIMLDASLTSPLNYKSGFLKSYFSEGSVTSTSINSSLKLNSSGTPAVSPAKAEEYNSKD